MTRRAQILASIGALALFGTVEFPVHVHSAEAEHSNIKECANIDNEASRLRCYDLVAGRAPTSMSASGRWTLTRTRNPLDDTTTATAMLVAASGESARGEKPYLVARCRSKEIEIYVDWHDYLGDDDSDVYKTTKRITHRFDSAKAKRTNWYVSTDHKASFYRDAERFLRSVASANQLVVQTTPYGESPVTALFDLTDSSAAVQHVAIECGAIFAEPLRPKQPPELIKVAQEKLKELGLYDGEIDGLWGPRTATAVREFQEKHYLEKSGYIDTTTIEFLDRAE